MDGQTGELVQDLSDEAVFDSRGEFQIDLARAREKLEQHLGLWPEDYLAFLIQAAYSLGATRLRLSTSWHSLLWEFDGPPLSRPQLEAVISEDRGRALAAPLQRLEMCFFLLSRSRYKRYTFASGLNGEGHQLEWNRGKPQLSRCRRSQSLANALEVILPLRHISVHWLVSRRSALSTLPEYAAVRPRYKDGPLRLEVPWTSPPEGRKPAPLAIAVQGKQRMSTQAPYPFAQVLHQSSDFEHSFWFIVQETGQLRCLVNSLGYEGPQWEHGGLWLYYDGLRTDLAQRQLVQGPNLQSLLETLEGQVGSALLEAFQDPALREVCSDWIWQRLRRWQMLGAKDAIGQALAQLPLFPMAFHGQHSLSELDQLYALGGPLYYCERLPARQPRGAPPVVDLKPAFERLLRSRFTDLRNCKELFEKLDVCEDNRNQWSMRAQESLELQNTVAHYRLTGQPWEGCIGLLSADVAPRLDVFLESRWLASVPLSSKFPKGLVGKVQHPELQMNLTWTEPEPTGLLWTAFQEELWRTMPGWFHQILQASAEVPEWLLDRAYQLLLVHPEPGPLCGAALIPVGASRVSLEDCQGLFEDDRWQSWIFRGWLPRDRGWALLNKLLEADERRAWKTRLELYQKGFDSWRDTPPRPVTLTQREGVLASLLLPQGRGEIGVRGLKANSVQVTAYREGRRLGSLSLPGMPLALGGLPEGLVVAVEHPGIWPNGDWTEFVASGPGWEQTLVWIWEAIPDLVGPLLQAREPLLAVRLLNWIPQDRWPNFEGLGDFALRLDDSSISLAQAVAALQQGPPVRVLEDPGAVRMLEGFGDLWLISKELASEIRSIWGPSRLVDAQSDYLAAWMALEHGLSQQELAVLPEAQWLLREPLEGGEIGLRLQPGPANRCHLRLLRKGHPLFEYTWPLVEGSEYTSSFRLEVVMDWTEAPVLTSFGQMWEDPVGRDWLSKLLRQVRLFGFQQGAPREFLWERLAFERDFSLGLDEVRLQLLRCPLFEIEGELWSLERLLAYLREQGRLGYVLGDAIDNPGAGPILFLTNRELHWLKLLLGQSQLANLSHIRKSLRQRQEVAEAPALVELSLPDLDYLLTERRPDRVWGLQREINGPSRLRLHRQMRPLEALTYDWRYQIQASLNLDDLQLTQDGRVRRDGLFQQALDELRNEVQLAIVERAPARYRLEMALWSWGVQEEWADQLHGQLLLQDPRGHHLSVAQWVEAWAETEGKLPFLYQEEDWTTQRELLPTRPVPLLPASLVTAASRMMRGLMDYREGLRQAWQFVHQSEAPPVPSASFQWQGGDLRVNAEFDWVEQHLVVLWRGREVHRVTREQWPGYVLEVDWSERLLGQAWPDWTEVTPSLGPYWKFLHSLLQQPDLLEERLEDWEALPVEAQSGPIPVYFEPNEADLRLLLARRKGEWLGRARGVYAPIQRVCEQWWGCPVEVEAESGEWPLRSVQGESGRRVYVNTAHRWFRGLDIERMALRVLHWLAGQHPGREGFLKRNQVLEQLGYLQ